MSGLLGTVGVLEDGELRIVDAQTQGIQANWQFDSRPRVLVNDVTVVTAAGGVSVVGTGATSTLSRHGGERDGDEDQSCREYLHGCGQSARSDQQTFNAGPVSLSNVRKTHWQFEDVGAVKVVMLVRGFLSEGDKRQRKWGLPRSTILTIHHTLVSLLLCGRPQAVTQHRIHFSAVLLAAIAQCFTVSSLLQLKGILLRTRWSFCRCTSVPADG